MPQHVRVIEFVVIEFVMKQRTRASSKLNTNRYGFILAYPSYAGQICPLYLSGHFCVNSATNLDFLPVRSRLERIR